MKIENKNIKVNTKDLQKEARGTIPAAESHPVGDIQTIVFLQEEMLKDLEKEQRNIIIDEYTGLDIKPAPLLPHCSAKTFQINLNYEIKNT